MTLTSRKMGRRPVLLGAAGLAAAGLTLRHTGSAEAQRGSNPVKVLMDDRAHRAAEFHRGTLRGAKVVGGKVRGPGGYDGSALTSSFRFTHAGLHWASRGGVQMEVRTSDDGTRWSDWHVVLIEATGDATASGETYGALVGAPRHRLLQYRATLDDGAELESVTATFLNSVDGPVSGAAAVADPTGTPVTFTREAWGADDSLRFSSSGSEIWPRMYVPVKKLMVHHTATTNSYRTVDEAQAEVRAIYAYHAVTLGWGDIGYNALIDKWGNVYEGRHGRGSSGAREVLSSGVTAGHATSHNYGSTGIALLGSFTKKGEGGKAGVQPSQPTLAALVSTLAFEADRNDLAPDGDSHFLLFDDTWNRDLPNINGHRDCTPTICPGGYVYDLLPAIRRDVATRLGRLQAAAQLVDAPEEATANGGAASYAWQPEPGVSYSFGLEGWRRIGAGEDIEYLSGFDELRNPIWSSPGETSSASFVDLPDGHYTFHLRAHGSEGTSYQVDRTLLMVNGSAPPSEPPPSVTLEASGYKVKGLAKADLIWSGASGDTGRTASKRDDVGRHREQRLLHRQHRSARRRKLHVPRLPGRWCRLFE